MIMGSNMAENHPVGFRFVMKAREKGATVIHVDPRFTRTSASANLYVPLRSGTDIAFLGGLINYVIENDRWFKDYVIAYTNASTIIDERFEDSEDVELTPLGEQKARGYFSGLNPEKGEYDNSSWEYAGDPEQSSSSPKSHSKAEQGGTGHGHEGAGVARHEPHRDETLQNPRCVFQILKRHYSRYTPEMVEQVCGTPKELFLQVAETLCKNSGRERTGAICYAVGWTQHSTGPQMIRAAGILQLLLGNMGRPGGGIMALRGHASIQGSTDIPTLYDLLPGYLAQPATFKKNATLQEYIDATRIPTGYWSNLPKFVISLLKAWYGEAATPENEYGYQWIGKITGDHSHLQAAVDMADGKVKGMIVFGQNPAAGSPNAALHRKGLHQLDWLVTVDLYETETSSFWSKAPDAGDPKTIKTEVFAIPAAAPAEKDGTLTNTQRLLQWHFKAADPPGDARSDTWFVYHLGRRLKELYKDSTEPKDQGLLNLTWDYLPEQPDPRFRINDEPSAEKVLKEINGFTVKDRKQLDSFEKLKDDGSTACGGWIYCGCFTEKGNMAARLKRDEWVSPEWAWAWPANRHLLYNRASADPQGKPWSERKKYIWWDQKQKKWTGYDVPDFKVDKAPSVQADPEAEGMDALSGSDPFIMKPDGRGWLFAPSGMKDGPLPTFYEPFESPMRNALYAQQSNPTAKAYQRPDNPISAPSEDQYPYAATTYRLTEQYLSGPMSRWLPWLNELQPEMFVEISQELATEKGIKNLDWVVVTSPRSQFECKALVTSRLKPLRMDGRIIHEIGVPIHFAYSGLVKGAIANDLLPVVSEPNVHIMESKAFKVNLRKGRLPNAVDGMPKK
jgi:formate dehydrogenase major subunit